MGCPTKTNYLTEAEYARAIAYNDENTNLTLLQRVMKRAEAGEPITVATIGGSITYGSLATDRATESYSAHFRDWWISAFPNSTVTHVNAGIGATTSHLGVHRVNGHVLSKNADVCIVEFTVNDSKDALYSATYESLVAKLLDRGVAVLLLFMTRSNGYSVQHIHAAIGAKYHLPMISYGDAVLPTIEAGERTWTDIAADSVHPNNYGHAYTAEILWRYLNEVYDAMPCEIALHPYDSAALRATPYYGALAIGPVETCDTVQAKPLTTGAFVLDKGDRCAYSGAWLAKPSSDATDNGEMTLRLTFSRLGILYTRTTDGESGTCDVYVDGEKIASVDGDFPGGWGNYHATAELYAADTEATHTVTLKMADPTKKFILIRLLMVGSTDGAQ